MEIFRSDEKTGGGRCKKHGCYRKVHGGGLCATHYRREWRENHPLKASYANLRSNAKRRGKPFIISFAYFCKFAIKCSLILNRGRTSESYTVDRIKNELGYVEGNIQALTKFDNCSKGTGRQKKLEYDYKTKYGRVLTYGSSLTEDDAPF